MRDELRNLRSRIDHPIRLVSLEIGEHPSAAVYMRNQRRAAENVGIEFQEVRLPADCPQAEVLRHIELWNFDEDVHGILVQRPMPDHIDVRIIQSHIAAEKDVEGMTPWNMGTILYRQPDLAPCTAAAAMKLLEKSEVDLQGAEAVVVGHSEIVGKPIAMFLLHHLSTVTVCHVGTRDLAAHTKRADIVVVAVGKAGLVTGDMLREGAVVVDIGINVTPDGMVGDCDFDTCSKVAAQITPVPGGVGPVTVAILMRNTLVAAGLAEAASV